MSRNIEEIIHFSFYRLISEKRTTLSLSCLIDPVLYLQMWLPSKIKDSIRIKNKKEIRNE